jgi:hypothetical protein
MRFGNCSHGGIGRFGDASLVAFAHNAFRQVFPRQINAQPVHKDSVLSKIKERRRRINELALNGASGRSE